MQEFKAPFEELFLLLQFFIKFYLVQNDLHEK
jgi:hypothetical protein